MNSNIKQMLLQEAINNCEKHRTNSIKSFILSQDTDFLNGLIKKAMSRSSGGSTLRNSGWNTKWEFMEPSDRIEKIKQEIEKTFGHYFNTIIDRKQVPIQAGITISNDPNRNSADPPATIYFRFKYLRTIIPENDPDSKNKAIHALGVLEKYFPGIMSFQEEIQNSNISLSPYFNVSSFSSQLGRVKSKPLQSFITKEEKRYSKTSLKTSTNVPINTSKFYKPHTQKLRSGENIEQTEYYKVHRIFSNQDIPMLRDAGQVLTAIASKVKDGYGLNKKTLQQTIKGLLNEKLSYHQLNRKSTDKRTLGLIQSYDHYYWSMYKKICDSYDFACLVPETVDDKSKINWGKGKRGLPVYKDKARLQCPLLSTEELKLTLQHLNAGQGSKLAADEFAISNTSTLYSANGFDSSSKNPDTSIPVLPPLRQLPNNQVVYDRDNTNLGRNQLVLNWNNGLGDFVKKWGKECEKWLKVLNGTLQPLKKESQEAFDAATLIKTNRTGAETILELLDKYPNWETFKTNHIDKSLSSEIRAVNGILANPEKIAKKQLIAGPRFLEQCNILSRQIQSVAQTNPDRANRIIRIFSTEVIDLFNNKLIDWDATTQALLQINQAATIYKGIDGNGVSGLKMTESETCINADDYPVLKQSGYAVAKMMDFVYALMTRCCEEIVNTHSDGRVERFYGHQYSSSSGKGAGGEIVLSVRYAYAAPELTSDPEIAKMVQLEQSRRQVKSQDILQRQTLHHQRATPSGRFIDPKDPTSEIGIMQPLTEEDAINQESTDQVVKIVENIEYFIGQTSSTSRWHKTLHSGMSWSKALEVFTRQYPDLQAQLDIVFEPMNANLLKLEKACKQAVDKVRKQIAVIYVNNEGKTEVMAGKTTQPTQTSTAPSQQKVPTPAKPKTKQPAKQPPLPATEQSNVTPAQSPSSNVTTTPAVKQPKNSPTQQVPTIPSVPPTSTTKPKRNVTRQPPKGMESMYISKNKPSKKLIRNMASIQDKLIKLADKLDQHGEFTLSDRIDNLINKFKDN